MVRGPLVSSSDLEQSDRMSCHGPDWIDLAIVVGGKELLDLAEAALYFCKLMLLGEWLYKYYRNRNISNGMQTTCSLYTLCLYQNNPTNIHVSHYLKLQNLSAYSMASARQVKILIQCNMAVSPTIRRLQSQ